MPIEFTSFISGGLIFAGFTSGVNVWREWANPTDDYWPNIGASSTADDSSAEGHRSYILRLTNGNRLQFQHVVQCSLAEHGES
jgi:hypothetical protein